MGINNVIAVEELGDYVLVGYIFNENGYSYKSYSYEDYKDLDIETLSIEPGDKIVLSDLQAEEVFLAVDSLEDGDKLCIVKDDDVIYYEECNEAIMRDCEDYPALGEFIEEVNDNMLFIDKAVVECIAFDTVDFSFYLGQFS